MGGAVYVCGLFSTHPKTKINRYLLSPTQSDISIKLLQHHYFIKRIFTFNKIRVLLIMISSIHEIQFKTLILRQNSRDSRNKITVRSYRVNNKNIWQLQLISVECPKGDLNMILVFYISKLKSNKEQNRYPQVSRYFYFVQSVIIFFHRSENKCLGRVIFIEGYYLTLFFFLQRKGMAWDI